MQKAYCPKCQDHTITEAGYCEACGNPRQPRSGYVYHPPVRQVRSAGGLRRAGR